ncbi:MAG: methyltransferase domain-containing protein [Phycisphaerales bacterium]
MSPSATVPTNIDERRARKSGSRVVYKLKRFIRYLGLYKRTTHTSDGVRYRERSGISLRRALSEHGPGVKEYDVRFPRIETDGRRTMRIRYTASRIYADVGHDPRQVLYRQFEEHVRPGHRIVEIGCGSGSGAAILARATGPSGGVVAIDRDGESIRFARQRHHSDHCGFELGWIETLNGEIDDAFDLLVGVDVLRGIDSGADESRYLKVIDEIVRVVGPGAVMVLIESSLASDAPKSDQPKDQPSRLQQLTQFLARYEVAVEHELTPCPRTGWGGIVCKKAGLAKPAVLRDPYEPGSFRS